MRRELFIRIYLKKVTKDHFIVTTVSNLNGKIVTKERESQQLNAISAQYRALMSALNGYKGLDVIVSPDNPYFEKKDLKIIRGLTRRDRKYTENRDGRNLSRDLYKYDITLLIY